MPTDDSNMWNEMNGGVPLRFRTYPDSTPKRTPEMEDHQHWVWLQGENPPQWQIRGTGVMMGESPRTADAWNWGGVNIAKYGSEDE